MGMLGNEETLNLSAKAQESRGLLKFIFWFLKKHSEDFQALAHEESQKALFLLAAAESALDLDNVFRVERRKLERSESQRLLASYLRFVSFYKRSGGVVKPKLHLIFHLIQGSLERGNPRHYSTYQDESLNAVFAKIARSAHRSTWRSVVHWKANLFHKNTFDKYTNKIQ